MDKLVILENNFLFQFCEEFVNSIYIVLIVFKSSLIKIKIIFNCKNKKIKVTYKY